MASHSAECAPQLSLAFASSESPFGGYFVFAVFFPEESNRRSRGAIPPGATNWLSFGLKADACY